jgi:hypothetical protein
MPPPPPLDPRLRSGDATPPVAPPPDGPAAALGPTAAPQPVTAFPTAPPADVGEVDVVDEVDEVESIELVRGEALPPPAWQRPRRVLRRPPLTTDRHQGSARMTIPPPPERPAGYRTAEPTIPSAAPGDQKERGEQKDEPRFVDLGSEPEPIWSAAGGARPAAFGAWPAAAAGIGPGGGAAADDDAGDVDGGAGQGVDGDADARATNVRLAPHRRVTAALALVVVLGVVGAVLLAVGRRDPSASSAYGWERLPAPVLAQPQRRWAVELTGAPPDRVVANTERIFLARSHDSVVTISALAAADGRTLWQADVDAAGSTVQQLELSGDLVVAVSGSNGVRTGVSAFDAASGARRWQTSLDASWVTVVNGTDPLVVLSGPSPRMATRADGLDLASGQPRWSRSGVVGDLDGRRLALVENEDVITVDIRDGRETGRWPGVAHGMTARTVVVSGSRVVVLSEDDLRLAGVGSSRLDGSLDPGIGQLFTTIRTGSDQVTVLSQDGVAGVDLGSGRIDWTRDVTPRALARADGQTILLGWSGNSAGTMVTIDTRNGRQEGTRDIDGLVRRPRDRRSSYISRADFLADGATYQVGGGGVEAYDLPALQPLWELGPDELGATARDVTATEAGLLITTTTGRLLLYS